MVKKVFISHSEQDKVVADLICSSLEAQNIGCWIAPRDIPYGNDWAGDITRAIEKCKVFLFVLSEHSNRSRQCPKEIAVADSIGVPLICIQIGNLKMNAGLKYHLSMLHTMFLDIDLIKMKLPEIVQTVQDKLKRKNLWADKTEAHCNIDELLRKAFAEKEKTESATIPKRSAITERMETVRINNFINRFMSDLDRLEADAATNMCPEEQPSQKILLNTDAQKARGVYFEVPNMDGFKTLVLQLTKNNFDYSTRTKFFNYIWLDGFTEEEKGGTSVFIDHPSKNGDPLVIIYFSSKEVFLNMAFLDENTLKISKSPVRIQRHKTEGSTAIAQLSNACYSMNKEALIIKDKNEFSDEAYWYDAEITKKPPILIDPDTGTPVLRELYYDKEEKRMRARIKLDPNKQYFSFALRSNNPAYQDGSSPMSELEQGVCYRKGLFGFPKDPMKAAELLENDASAQAKYEIALIFKEPGDFHDATSYRELLLQSAEDGCEEAAVELALSIAFHECDDVPLEKCLDLLRNRINCISGAANFVLGYLLENEHPETAFAYYRKAAAEHYAPAIARFNCKSLEGESEKVLRAAFKKTLDENRGVAEYCMGCACYFGFDMEQRKETGFSLIKEAAYLSDPEAQRILVQICDNEETKKDL